MKDKLEKFILDNKEEFDIYEPSPELWGKIEKQVHKRTINWMRVAWRAAAVILIFGASYLVHDVVNFDREGRKDVAKVEVNIPEVKEAEAYYTSMINNKLEEIKPMLTNYPGLDKEINSDLNQLDSIYNDLKKDLRDNVANDEVINAMIQNYRLRIAVLEDVLHELSKNNEDDDEKKYNNI